MKTFHSFTAAIFFGFQFTALLARSTNVSAAETASTGPDLVIHRSLYDLDDSSRRTNAAMIDLDSSRVFSPSAFVVRSDQPFEAAFEAGLKHARNAGIDLWSNSSRKTLIAFETVIVPAEQPFDRITREGIATNQRLAHLPSIQTEIAVREVPAIYLFKTREGGRGTLEVTRFGINLESVDIRYRVLPPRHYFVRHLVVLSPAGGSRYLSLPDAKTYAAMPTNAPVVYMEKQSEGGWSIVVENVHNYPTERERGVELWNAMSAEAISEPAGLAGLPFERTGNYQLVARRFPITVLIPGYGLLQVNHIDRGTDQVSVEYKQVTTNAPSGRVSNQGGQGRSTSQ